VGSRGVSRVVNSVVDTIGTLADLRREPVDSMLVVVWSH